MFSWWGERTVGRASWRPALSVIVLSALMLSDPALAQQRDAGWWVVVGSYPSTPPARQQGDLQRVSAAARRCGLRPINDDFSEVRRLSARTERLRCWGVCIAPGSRAHPGHCAAVFSRRVREAGPILGRIS